MSSEGRLRAQHRLPPSSWVAVGEVRPWHAEAATAHVKEGVYLLISFVSPWKGKKEKDDGRYLETLSKGASDLFVLMFTRWSFDNCLSKLSKTIDRKKLIIIDNDAISFHK